MGKAPAASVPASLRHALQVRPRQMCVHKGRPISPAPTHAELANRIGAHRVAVTREMRALAQLNIVRSRRRSLGFVTLEALERAVHRHVSAPDDLRGTG